MMPTLAMLTALWRFMKADYWGVATCAIVTVSLIAYEAVSPGARRTKILVATGITLGMLFAAEIFVRSLT